VSALVAASASSVAAQAATRTPQAAPKPSASATPTPATTGAAAEPQSGKLGQTLLLARPTGGPIAVTVVKVVNPDTATKQAESPPLGEHLESIEFHIKNAGTTPYQENPFIDINASDDDATIVEFAPVTATHAGPQLPMSLNLAPGASVTGFATFDVLEGDNISSVVYALDGGLYGSSGDWQLG
jgi:hypothetical protein